MVVVKRKRGRHFRRAVGRLPGLVLAVAFGIVPGAAAGQTVTEIVLPNVGSAPIVIAAGPDESVWFTEQHGNRIGRIGRCGELAEFTVPTAGSFPRGITAGPAKNLWFTG